MDCPSYLNQKKGMVDKKKEVLRPLSGTAPP